MSLGSLPDVVRDALAPLTSTQQQSAPAANVPQSATEQSPPIVPPKTPATKKNKPPKPKQEKRDGQNETVLIELPLGELNSQFPNSRVDLHLHNDNAKKMRRLLNGLKADNAKLINGKCVKTNADVVRWLLDQIEG